MKETDKRTEKITIWGIVQGVGFRPFTAKLADRLGICGEVRNAGGLVEITVTNTAEDIRGFLSHLKDELPPPGEIVHIKRETLKNIAKYSGFTISQSSDGEDEAAALPADLAVCPRCLKELRDPQNRRLLHPFISCMSCGPRYTIVDRTPYDRENTSMADFVMCADCEAEYTNREDVRYHAQTISCHECGPTLLWRDGGSRDDVERSSGSRNDVERSGDDVERSGDCRPPDGALDPLHRAIRAISGGGVIAFKATGGYCFVCSPFHTEALQKLRNIKVREEKPFALMFPDMEIIKRYCYVNDEEESLLTSAARPIVLLEKRKIPNEVAVSPEVCRSSRFIGAFLPSIGAQYMLAWELGPLIMTSANLSDMPIIKDEQEMWETMSRQPLVDGALYNSRAIRTRMDDSVVRIIDARPQMIRRSKGYVPSPIYIDAIDELEKSDMIFAAGGHLKAAFTLTKGNIAYISQYFGDLDSIEAENVYIDGLERMKSLFRIEPELIVCDAHPLYAATRIAEEYAAELTKKRGAAAEGEERILRVQHHHAHIASVMAEHGIKEPVIGVAFDGTGYGADGKIWGGEILLCEGWEFERMAHLKYVPMIGGDTSMKSAWKSAVSYMHDYNKSSEPELTREGKKAAPSEALPAIISVDISDIIDYCGQNRYPYKNEVISAIESGVNTVESSSMGRLFDAVASLLGISDESRYEGECAILLENAAAEAINHIGRSRIGDLALKFHMDVAAVIAVECERVRDKTGVNKVALSGGVFQNKILMEESLRLLRELRFSVYYNIAAPPNDGGISLGQAYIGMKYLEKKRYRA
ncbi:MAG: carbamoyltransferase HypF [Clostridiales Family XIII bacterium]|jgi:hydrogenase maturation protein HypF|nr:carbamoyltransferase HypF [Clostridiales Family XIII bacterium]